MLIILAVLVYWQSPKRGGPPQPLQSGPAPAEVARSSP
jgi:hypothetical protein